jgi:signal transduction histidine kinase
VIANRFISSLPLTTGQHLSLSYDIVKAHGGEIKVEAKEGEGSEFIIAFNNT